MSWVLLLIGGILLAVLQRRWAPEDLKRLTVRGRADRLLAEPGETITWYATVENHSKLPVLFSRLQLHFPGEASFLAQPQWIQSHCRQTLYKWHVEERLQVRSRRSVTKRVSVSLPARGLYEVGSYRLSAGDLLGFREAFREGPGGQVVVIPEKSRNQKILEALGGFLGDISVRRFVMEDPILTAGFRDYTGREPMKTISWSRTAVTGTLQVKQYDHTAEQTVMVLLDTEGGTPEQLEGCFRLMRTVCEQLERRKIPYGLRTNGSLPGPVSKLFYLAEGLGDSHLNTALYALGRADYACYHSLRYMSQQTVRSRRKNESYILVTPAITAEKWNSIRMLQEAAGNPVCVLSGQEEASAV